MHLFHIPQCTSENRNMHISVLNGALWDIPRCTIQKRNVHISVLNGSYWGMEQVHYGICEFGLLLRYLRFVVTSDKLWCHQWWQSWHHNKPSDFNAQTCVKSPPVLTLFFTTSLSTFSTFIYELCVNKGFYFNKLLIFTIFKVWYLQNMNRFV